MYSTLTVAQRARAFGARRAHMTEGWRATRAPSWSPASLIHERQTHGLPARSIHLPCSSRGCRHRRPAIPLAGWGRLLHSLATTSRHCEAGWMHVGSSMNRSMPERTNRRPSQAYSPGTHRVQHHQQCSVFFRPTLRPLLCHRDNLWAGCRQRQTVAVAQLRWCGDIVVAWCSSLLPV